jgi:hypothetical protein
MATNFLTLVNGVPRQQTNIQIIYEQNIDVISGVAANSNQIQGPVTAGTQIVLPLAQTYISVDLEIYLNGDRLNPILDYSYVGTGSRTRVALTFDLVVGDTLVFRINNTAGSVAGLGVTSFNARTGAVVLTTADVDIVYKTESIINALIFG